MSEKIVLEATFNPSVKTYWLVSLLLFSTLIVIGIPLLVTEFEWSDNERKAALDTGVQAKKILRAAGAITMDINQGEKLDEGGDAIHEMGTARMGADPKTSVVNRFNRVHSIDNLYVTDGSFMSSSSCVNPSLTYMAFTARACEHAVTRLKEEALI